MLVLFMHFAGLRQALLSVTSEQEQEADRLPAAPELIFCRFGSETSLLEVL